MSWTDERIDTLRKMWEAGQTASQIADALGEVSRNAVIGKAHRLGLQSRPSPVRPNEPAPVPVPASEPVAAVREPEETETEPDEAPEVMRSAPHARPLPLSPFEIRRDADPQPVMRSVGPGGFVRQSPGEQAPPATPAPPRRLVPARPSAEIADKTGLLDLNDRICKWPLGHPGEPDFHFCGDKVNPGFPYCVAHCGHAYQAQLPRRDRRGPPPLPFGGARR